MILLKYSAITYAVQCSKFVNIPVQCGVETPWPAVGSGKRNSPTQVLDDARSSGSNFGMLFALANINISMPFSQMRRHFLGYHSEPTLWHMTTR